MINNAVNEMNIQYQLFPEWSEQDAVMLTWPHRGGWADTLNDIDQVFTQVTFYISQEEKVLISCFDQEHRDHIKHLLQQANVDLNQVSLYLAKSNDIWVRDHGPIAVLNKHQWLLLDFVFNGWGNKYPAHYDNEISRLLNAQHAFNNTPLSSIDFVLEGGAIEVDGQGTLLTTSSCLLAKNRNPHLSKTEITSALQKLLGIKRILWLDHGHLSGDDTDGHIDTLARYVDAHTICYITCDDENDEHYTELKAMEEQLKTFKDYEGNPYRLVALPWAKKHFASYDGRRLPATYANFLIINNAVLVPTYEDDVTDQKALEILKKCFPDRKIIAIPSVPIIQWYGSLHCMTMQLPHGVLTHESNS